MIMLGYIYQFLFQMSEMGFSCSLDVQYCAGWLSLRETIMLSRVHRVQISLYAVLQMG